jgi:predicted CoA-binding protein
VQSPSDSDLRDIFQETRTIAILGAHTDPGKPACYVPDYLHAQGYDVHPVNPTLVGRNLWGHPTVATLADLTTPIDVVDVFRRSESLLDHVDEILIMDPRPRLVWLQLGISHAEFARQLREVGIRVIQDRCTLAEHRRLGLTR